MVHYRFTMIHEHSDAVTYIKNKTKKPDMFYFKNKTNKNYNYIH